MSEEVERAHLIKQKGNNRIRWNRHRRHLDGEEEEQGNEDDGDGDGDEDDNGDDDDDDGNNNVKRRFIQERKTFTRTLENTGDKTDFLLPFFSLQTLILRNIFMFPSQKYNKNIISWTELFADVQMKPFL